MGEARIVLDEPETFGELLTHLKGLDGGGGCVWRGQSNWLWSAIPSLYRRLRNGGLSDEQINEGTVQMIERELVNEGRKAGLHPDTFDDILSFMVDVQHYGGATRLLDVTHDFRVAVYFACHSQSDAKGVVMRYEVSPSRVFRQDDGATWEDVLASEKGRPILLEPSSKSNVRVRAQRGAFITTVLDGSLAQPNVFGHQTGDSQLRLVLVRPEVKRDAQSWLRCARLTEDELFPPTIETFAPRFAADATPRMLR